MNQLKWGLIDLHGNAVLPIQYDFIDGVSEDGIASVCMDGVWRYVHLDGTVAIRGEFERAFQFRSGLALVQKKGLYGMINEEGEQVIECKYERCLNFSPDLAPARLNGKYGYIDRKGEVVVPHVYEDAQIPSEGFGWLMNSTGMWGCVDTEGKPRIPFRYEEAEPFGEFLSFVIGDAFKGFINSSDDLVIKADGWSRSKGGFRENVACVYGVPRRASWGCNYIDHSGRFTMKEALNEAYSFAGGRACIRVKKRYGFIDTLGELVIPAIFEETVGLGFFKGEMAAVKYNGKYGCIDVDGNVVVPFRYDLAAITNRRLLRVALES